MNEKITICVFDTETTWLYSKEKKIDEQPHIIQFAWIFWEIGEDGVFTQTEVIDELFKPPIEIPVVASEIHHIYNVDVKDKPPIEEWIPSIIEKLNNTDIIIWHNIEFDLTAIRTEVNRLKLKWVLIDFAPQKTFCTMNESIKYCKLPKKSWKGFKRPKLQELTKKALWEYLLWAHNAFVDVECTL